jgi:hypothetical protein
MVSSVASSMVLVSVAMMILMFCSGRGAFGAVEGLKER